MKRIVLLCAVFSAPLTGASDDAPSTPAPAAFLAVSVSDLDASVQWYTEMLDLTATVLPGSPEVRIALLQGDGLVVELLQHAGAVPRSDRLPDAEKPYLVHGFFKAGFFVKDLDATVAELRRRGAKFKGTVFTDDVLQARSILLLDNGGNVIQLFERLPGEPPPYVTESDTTLTPADTR